MNCKELFALCVCVCVACSNLWHVPRGWRLNICHQQQIAAQLQLQIIRCISMAQMQLATATTTATTTRLSCNRQGRARQAQHLSTAKKKSPRRFLLQMKRKKLFVCSPSASPALESWSEKLFCISTAFLLASPLSLSPFLSPAQHEIAISKQMLNKMQMNRCKIEKTLRNVAQDEGLAAGVALCNCCNAIDAHIDRVSDRAGLMWYSCRADYISDYIWRQCFG